MIVLVGVLGYGVAAVFAYVCGAQNASYDASVLVLHHQVLLLHLAQGTAFLAFWTALQRAHSINEYQHCYYYGQESNHDRRNVVLAVVLFCLHRAVESLRHGTNAAYHTAIPVAIPEAWYH